MDQKHDEHEFREFVDREFDRTTKFSSADDLIEFAFGDLESAVGAFEKARGKLYQTPAEYLDNEYFSGFVSDEYDDVSVYASDEEISEWAIGSVEEAETEFKGK